VPAQGLWDRGEIAGFAAIGAHVGFARGRIAQAWSADTYKRLVELRGQTLEVLRVAMVSMHLVPARDVTMTSPWCRELVTRCIESIATRTGT
jgi:hypothetical protein